MSEPQVVGNPVVIELLEAYLETAKTMRFGHVAIAMTGYPNVAAVDYAGDIGLEEASREAVGMLKTRLEESIGGWTFPWQDESLDASYVRYNVAHGPLGFDFLIWLIDAEMTRVREGAPAPLKVAFWLGAEGAPRPNHALRQAWLNNVFRPALALIGAVEDERALRGRCKEFYLSGDICAAVRAGEAVPVLKAPRKAHEDVAGLGLVTITLREAGHWPHRNSNLEAWYAFARDLTEAGERVVFVRDTAKAHEPISGFVTAGEASIDLHHRAALYEAAKVNLFVSNGPNILALFGERPFLLFCGVEADDHPYLYNTPSFWKEKNGVAVGEQYPWHRRDQRIIWQRDTYENITAAWNELKPLLRSAVNPAEEVKG